MFSAGCGLPEFSTSLLSIRFSVNKRIFVVGFGLYGSIHGPTDYQVNIQVHSYPRPAPPHPQSPAPPVSCLPILPRPPRFPLRSPPSSSRICSVSHPVVERMFWSPWGVCLPRHGPPLRVTGWTVRCQLWGGAQP